MNIATTRDQQCDQGAAREPTTPQAALGQRRLRQRREHHQTDRQQDREQSDGSEGARVAAGAVNWCE